MDKVKVSREVAEVLNTLEKTKLSKDAVLRNYATFLDEGVERKTNPCQTFVNDGISLLGLAEILVKGYEVEQTPAEKIKELFEKNLDMYDQAKENGLDEEAMFRDGRSDGILRTLEILNIKVPGVNE